MFNLKNIILLVCLSLTSANHQILIGMNDPIEVSQRDPHNPLFTVEEIAEFEALAADAAKVKKNPQHGRLFDIKNYLEEATKKLADGKLDYAKVMINNAISEINDYCTQLIAKTEWNPNEGLTEQDAYNIRAIIDSSKDIYRLMAETVMPKNEVFDLNIHRILSLEKLYLFEQKGGENYLT